MRTPAKGKTAVRQTAAKKLGYIRKNWQLYIFFLMPALLLTVIFKYLPMGGVLIAFEDYNVIDGIFGSEWVGLEYFRRFLSSPDLSYEYPETQSVWSALGIPGSDHTGASVKPYPSDRNPEKNPAFNLRAEFYFCYCPLRYGAYVPVACGTDQSGSWN